MNALLKQQAAVGTSAANTILTITVAAQAENRIHVHGTHAHFQDGTTSIACTLTLTINGTSTALIYRMGTTAFHDVQGMDLVADAGTAVTWVVAAGGTSKVSEAHIIYSREAD